MKQRFYSVDYISDKGTIERVHFDNLKDAESFDMGLYVYDPVPCIPYGFEDYDILIESCEDTKEFLKSKGYIIPNVTDTTHMFDNMIVELPQETLDNFSKAQDATPTFGLKGFENRDFVVRCKYKPDAKLFVRFLFDNGWTWNGREDLFIRCDNEEDLYITNWDTFKENTIYFGNPNKNLTYDSYDDIEIHGVKHIIDFHPDMILNETESTQQDSKDVDAETMPIFYRCRFRNAFDCTSTAIFETREGAEDFSQFRDFCEHPVAIIPKDKTELNQLRKQCEYTKKGHI